MNLDAVKDYRVLLVGDGIIDEYVYVKPLGKSIKDVAISARFERRQSFQGGVWAAAAHTRNFCKQVDVLAGRTIMKNVRFVEEAYVRKMFTLHEAEVVENWQEADNYAGVDSIRSYDLVIVADFGHGTLTKELTARLFKEARYLAVNAQTNTTNYGFNLITRYKGAHFVVIDELEARLAAHDRDSDIEDVILALGFRNIIVTMGYNGAVGFDGAFHRVKGTTINVVDTMGAGDAFLAVSSPYAASGASMKNLIRIGNAAGAVKVGIIGHRESVTKEELRGRLEH